MLNIVIPAGGSGTRLWPLSRKSNPKFLHALSGTPATLLQATVNRVIPVTTPEHTYVVTGTAHAVAVARQLPELPDENVLVEPSPKDSCGAIGLAAVLIARKDPQALMGAFSADHIVQNQERFLECVRAAIAGAEQGRLVVFGITPTYPETGYGYIECGEVIDGGPVRKVSRFKEKPTLDVATEYVNSGEFYWNASMFVWRVDVFLAELERQQPELHAGLQRIAAAWGTREQETVLAEVWPTLPKISLDYAVMEGAAEAGLVAAVPSDFGWTDVGDFHALGEALRTSEDNPDENIVVDGTGVGEGGGKPVLVLEDSHGLVIVPQSGRLIAAVGVRDLAIVDSPDALLICDRRRAQEVKKVVDRIRDEGLHDLL
ncbi:mannose-1-phosphate guanylyltransferase [Kribbella sp. CA-294648]|uniref:mannose-1-phosphate guanylyltransferase n=1 Tax=Kribbella sp. CA-294648 TaxID=3239948 RepID=UPI003D90BA0A